MAPPQSLFEALLTNNARLDYLLVSMHMILKRGIIMRTLLIIAALLAFTPSTYAACFGTGALRYCTDNSGNTYNSVDLGNSTITNGYNANTGSNWSQTDTTFGNTTITNGQAANGNSWNMTKQNFGGMTTYSGTNSNGETFFKTCTQFSCN